jgi:hypothetical protein
MDEVISLAKKPLNIAGALPSPAIVVYTTW